MPLQFLLAVMVREALLAPEQHRPRWQRDSAGASTARISLDWTS